MEAACEVLSVRDFISANQRPVLASNCDSGADFWGEKWKTQYARIERERQRKRKRKRETEKERERKKEGREGD